MSYFEITKENILKFCEDDGCVVNWGGHPEYRCHNCRDLSDKEPLVVDCTVFGILKGEDTWNKFNVHALKEELQ